MILNAAHAIDFYKSGHHRQYPEGTTRVVSNFTPRSMKHGNVPLGGVVFFGLQYFIEDYLVNSWNGFFRTPKEVALADYQRRMDNALGPGAVTTEHLGELHDLGYLPLEIRALPEGSFVNFNTPCVTVHNTIGKFFWLTNYIETIMSSYLWLPSTSATTAMYYRTLFEAAAQMSHASPEFIPFQGHDFSFRGMPGPQAAAMSGAGHLLFFNGTDTVPAIDFVERYYYANSDETMIGGSVPATEHSVMCMGGNGDGEFETFKRLITEVYPTGIVSIVSDTWDLWTVLTDYMPRLKDEILARDGKVVIRADSGDPADIILGEYLSDNPAARKGALALLWETFGGTMNDAGFRVLDPHVGLIYGDSITPKRCLFILSGMLDKSFSSENIVLGIGSYTYQMVTRDTWGWAMKATYGEINGEGRPIFKDPVTDDGVKKSHLGLLHVDKETGIVTQDVSWEQFRDTSNALRPVWRDGMESRKSGPKKRSRKKRLKPCFS